jgi:hypothetical protein
MALPTELEILSSWFLIVFAINDFRFVREIQGWRNPQFAPLPKLKDPSAKIPNPPKNAQQPQYHLLSAKPVVFLKNRGVIQLGEVIFRRQCFSGGFAVNSAKAATGIKRDVVTQSASRFFKFPDPFAKPIQQFGQTLSPKQKKHHR